MARRANKTRSDVSEQQIKTLLAAIANGSYREVAAAACGITPEQLDGLLGKADPVDRMSAADAKFELAIVMDIRRAVKKDWRAGQWLLEHRAPERWGKLRPGERHEGNKDVDDGPPSDVADASDPLDGVTVRFDNRAAG